LKQLQSVNAKELSDKQKLRMYELRDEVMKEAKDALNHKLLLRPKSFAVYWKLFFAVCLIWELANAAAKPCLYNPNKKESKSNNADLPATFGEFIAE
jgi:hypothetical protein